MIEDCLRARGPAALRARSRAGVEAAARLEQLPPACGPAPGSSPCGAKRRRAQRDLPRGWILSDAAIFRLAEASPRRARRSPPRSRSRDPMNEALAESLLEALREALERQNARLEPPQESRPTPEQKALIDRLAERGRCSCRCARRKRRNTGPARRAQGARDGRAQRAGP